jgi:broad specificity phosphatase PhoE
VWKKLHIGIDVETQEIITAGLTTNGIDDAKAAAALLAREKERIKVFLW